MRRHTAACAGGTRRRGIERPHARRGRATVAARAPTRVGWPRGARGSRRSSPGSAG
ncbi:oxidoreductase, partial [Burkholderia pseudomallei]